MHFFLQKKLTTFFSVVAIKTQATATKWVHLQLFPINYAQQHYFLRPEEGGGVARAPIPPSSCAYVLFGASHSIKS